MKYAEKCFHTLIIAGVIGFGLGVTNTAQAHSKTVRDHYTTIVQKEPYYVQVCQDVTTSGDKTGDTLKGAIIGGIIGNNVGDVKNGGALGAVIGGMLGHSKSDASPNVITQCRNHTNYTTESRRVYSHSIITFMHNGRYYKLRFQK